MLRNHEPDHGFDGPPGGGSPDLDDREPGGAPRGWSAELGDQLGDDDRADDPERAVAHRPARLPIREADDEELAEADIMEELELDDLNRMDGPDA